MASSSSLRSYKESSSLMYDDALLVIDNLFSRRGYSMSESELISARWAMQEEISLKEDSDAAISPTESKTISDEPRREKEEREFRVAYRGCRYEQLLSAASDMRNSDSPEAHTARCNRDTAYRESGRILRRQERRQYQWSVIDQINFFRVCKQRLTGGRRKEEFQFEFNSSGRLQWRITDAWYEKEKWTVLPHDSTIFLNKMESMILNAK